MTVGNTPDSVLEEWRLVAEKGWMAGQYFVLAPGKTVIGRDKTCDITIPGTHLSRRNTELILNDDHLLIRDLASANGTFVNETRISGDTPVEPGNIIRMDLYSFRVLGPASLSKPAAATPQTFSPEDTLRKIEALRNRDMSGQKNWITKPTSPGNRDHNVPARKTGMDPVLMIAAGAGALTIAIILYWMFVV